MHLLDLKNFLSELEINNNRPWFVMNKPRYDILREEFLILVTSIISEVAQFDPLIASCNPKKALFRINRDIRFSNDKRPYKTNFSAAIVPNDLKRPRDGGGPCYYFHIDATGQLLYGAGEYTPPSPRLKFIREKIISDENGFTKMLASKALVQRYGSLQEEGKLSRPPRGFPPDHSLIEYIKLKSFFVWNESLLNLTNPDLLAPLLLSGFKDALPLVKWLRSVQPPNNGE